METKELYREILNEHNLHPTHKKSINSPTLVLDGVNPSCGDSITLNLKLDGNDTIVDGSFTGSGCAISQASCDIMLDLIIGKKKDEALCLSENFMSMIQGQATERQKEELDEAAILEDISKMPARVKCAVLGWKTMTQMLQKNQSSGSGDVPHCKNCKA